jgi:hypothetical protein
LTVKTRNAFGWIFLLAGLVVFYILAANSISAELADVLHGPPFTDIVRNFTHAHLPGLDAFLYKILPARVQDLPHINAVNTEHLSTNDNPFMQFKVVTWMGWAFIAGAFVDVATAFMTRTKTQVEE